MHMELLSQGLYKAAQDEEKAVFTEVFIDSKHFCKVVMGSHKIIAYKIYMQFYFAVWNNQDRKNSVSTSRSFQLLQRYWVNLKFKLLNNTTLIALLI